jgi:hypothetical protein
LAMSDILPPRSRWNPPPKRCAKRSVPRPQHASARVPRPAGSGRSRFLSPPIPRLAAGRLRGFALLLASLGIYALILYSVSRRLREIGIRLALERPSAICKAPFCGRLRCRPQRLLAGLIASRLLATVIGSMLFRVTAGDPGAFPGITALMTFGTREK